MSWVTQIIGTYYKFRDGVESDFQLITAIIFVVAMIGFICQMSKQKPTFDRVMDWAGLFGGMFSMHWIICFVLF